MSHILFQAFAFFIHAYNAFLLAFISKAHFGFLSFHQTIKEIAASVLTHTSLSFTQKSNVTKSQSKNVNHFLGIQCTTTLFTLIQIFEGKSYTHLNQHKTLCFFVISQHNLSISKAVVQFFKIFSISLKTFL
jgi:hypothetical protein